MKDNVTITGSAHTDRIHDSAIKHVTGAADYTDDIAQPEGTLHAYLGVSTVTHARIVSLDLSAVRAAPGVVGVLTAADIPGHNDISPTGQNDEPVFPTDLIQFHGQPLFAVVAETRDAARRAAELAKVLEAGGLPNIAVLRRHFAPDPACLPAVTVQSVSLDSYEALVKTADAAGVPA